MTTTIPDDARNGHARAERSGTDGLLRLDDPGATAPLVAGHKAATLAALRRAGHRVPPGVVVPVELADLIRREGHAALDLDMRGELERSIDALGGVVAVRSSGTAEDLDDASWAGQYDTVLGVRDAGELWDAVAQCLASAESARADAYRQDTSPGDAGPAPLAVLVQQQVDADVAGVVFTANPVTGDDEVVVSAVRGLGDRLVGGEVTPEDWVVPPGGPPTRRGGPDHVLSAAQVELVAVEARRIATSLGTPVDVEWAIAGGELEVLQARPITALPVPPVFDVPTEGTWEKDASHFTDPMSPIGATLYFAPFDAALTEMAQTYGLLIDGAETRCLGGEMYTRIVPPGGADGPAPPWWLMGVLLRVVPSMRARLRTARRALADDLPHRTLHRWPEEWRPELERRIDELRAVDLADLDTGGLRAHLDRVGALSADGQRVHFLLFVPYLMALHDLVIAARDLLGWEEQDALELVGGLSGTSSAPARDLREIAGLVASDPSVGALVTAWSGEPPFDLLGRLRSSGGAAVADRLEAHLDRFGCRTTGYDPGRPSIAERPDLVLGVFRDLVTSGATPDGLESELSSRRADADARLDAAARSRGVSSADRDRLRTVVDRAREAWPVREDNLFYTDSMPVGLLRLAMLEIGRRLVAERRLRRADDACWLEAGEVHAILDGRTELFGDLVALVARRRAERAWVAAHPGPTYLGAPPSAPPDLRAAPEAIRRTSGAMLWGIAHEYPGERQGSDAEGIRGTPGAPGLFTGTVRVVRTDDGFADVQAGEVLVCPITSPAWSVLFGRIGALVTDAGGMLSHASIVAREHGLPAVVGTGNATSMLRDGQQVTVDGTAGVVHVHGDHVDR